MEIIDNYKVNENNFLLQLKEINVNFSNKIQEKYKISINILEKISKLYLSWIDQKIEKKIDELEFEKINNKIIITVSKNKLKSQNEILDQYIINSIENISKKIDTFKFTHSVDNIDYIYELEQKLIGFTNLIKIVKINSQDYSIINTFLHQNYNIKFKEDVKFDTYFNIFNVNDKEKSLKSLKTSFLFENYNIISEKLSYLYLFNYLLPINVKLSDENLILDSKMNLYTNYLYNIPDTKNK